MTLGKEFASCFAHHNFVTGGKIMTLKSDFRFTAKHGDLSVKRIRSGEVVHMALWLLSQLQALK